MDLALSERQKMLQNMARDFFKHECSSRMLREIELSENGHSPELWHKMAEQGWMGLVLPEEYGGGAGSFIELLIVLEEMGRICLPSPFLSTVLVGGETILRWGSEAQRQSYLSQISSGRLVIAPALLESSGRYVANDIHLTATPNEDGYLLDGTKVFASYVAAADYLICAARTAPEPERVSLFLVAARQPGISWVEMPTLFGPKQYEVTFGQAWVSSDMVLGELGHGWAYVKEVLPKAIVAQCAQVLGAAQQVLEMTIGYAKTRLQFGRPIGSFQVIQHYAANMLSDVDSLRLITYEAGWKISEQLPHLKEVAMAKAWANEAMPRIIRLAHQIHGAIGLTEDHDLPRYSKWAEAWEVEYGSADLHREALASLLSWPRAC